MRLHGKKKSNQVNVYVQEISPGIWKSKKKGRYRYRQSYDQLKPFIEDLGAAMDCVERSFCSSWWD